VFLRLSAVASRAHSAGPSEYEEFKQHEMSMFQQ
jgi:hypothetical protein